MGSTKVSDEMLSRTLASVHPITLPLQRHSSRPRGKHRAGVMLSECCPSTCRRKRREARTPAILRKFGPQLSG